MMELTPLDVRKKKGDFRRGLRGYEPGVVDDFLDLVADRMEKLVREAATNVEKVARLEQQVADYRDREKALTEALVTAQEMREEIRAQSAREVEILRRQAEQDAESIRGDAVRAREREEGALNSLRSKQLQFLASYRTFLEQELSDLAAHARALEMQAGRVGAAAPATPPTPKPPPKPAAPSPPPPTEVPSPPVPEAVGNEPSKDAVPSVDAKIEAPAAVAAAPVAAAVAPPTPQAPVPTVAESESEPEPVEEPSPGEGEEDIDAHVGAALAEWTTEFDELIEGLPAAEAAAETDGEGEAELILSDDDVVAGDSELILDDSDIASGPEAGEAADREPEPAVEPDPEPAYDEKEFNDEVNAAFSDTDAPDDDLLDLDSFDSLRGEDPALGESIVGPPPVIPPDQLTISPVFLERAHPEGEPEGGDGGGERQEPSPRQDMFSSMFEDDG
ncbi:MAG: DivIVA domain-containing protein [Gemmatimonadota bacterium]|jgi:DivIVA domain-containing protein